MAVTKIWPIYSNLSYSLNYIAEDGKTAEQTLLTYQFCSKENALEDFNQIIEDPRATNRHFPDGKRVLARHLVQSFKPDEVDPFTAHQIGMELAEKHLGGKYQFIVATHVNTDHIHNHIIFNNVSFIDYHCYNSNKRSYQEIRNLSDEICKEYGLDIVMEIDKEKTVKYPYATQSKYKNTYRDILRADIDQAVKRAINFEDYLTIMREKDYEIKQGKYMTYRHKNNGQKKFIRDRSLGEDYLKDSIIERIDRESLDLDSPLAQLPISNRRLEAIIDLDSDPQFKTSPGLRHWAIKQNNNRFMETMNQMIKLGVGSYEQLAVYENTLESKIDEIEVSISTKKKEIEVIKNNLRLFKNFILVYENNYKSETYITLTPEIDEIFKLSEINYDVKDLNKVVIDIDLINRIKDIQSTESNNLNTIEIDMRESIKNMNLYLLLMENVKHMRNNFENYLSIDVKQKEIEK